MILVLTMAGALLAGYVLFVLARLGFPGRLALLATWNNRMDLVLEEGVRRYGDRILIRLVSPLAWTDQQCWSARDLLKRADQLSGCFAHLSIGVGDRVAIYKSNEIDYFICSVAAFRLGAIAVPMNANVDAGIAARYLERMGTKLLVSDLEAWQRLQVHSPAIERVVLTDIAGAPAAKDVYSLSELLSQQLPVPAPVPRGPSDPLYIVHTSGTTGTPKGVILKSEGLAQSLRSIVLFNLVSPRDLACFALPLNHQVSHLYLHGALLMGVPCILNRELDAHPLLRQIEEHKPSVFFGFPITYTRLLAAGAETLPLSSIRIWGTTADASHEVQQRALVVKGSFFRRLGIPLDGSLFVDGLGSSEVGIAALLRITTPWTRRFGRRVGRRTPLGPRIKIADRHGNPVSKGQAGLLMIKGKSMFDGYWNAHDTLYAATRDGWWCTGDVLCNAEDGELIHLDREVDVMHTKNGPVYTLPMEEVVLKHPSVLDTSVFGVRPFPDAEQVPAAVVALRSDQVDIDAEELLLELNGRLSAPQQLAYLWIIAWQDFPIGATGKTLKRRLRERYETLLHSFNGNKSSACPDTTFTELSS